MENEFTKNTPKVQERETGDDFSKEYFRKKNIWSI
jgi:hypothetical protein